MPEDPTKRLQPGPLEGRRWRVRDLGLAVDEYRPVAPSIPLLTAELQDGEKGPAYDAVLHAGDCAPPPCIPLWPRVLSARYACADAYDFSNDGGRIGDNFM